ncbi:hypothetical protein OIDMADRAFT_169738 [Oidiodendron maius Zn]|uniref:F-box domain-containing protein n=1 Tax=Oidiodendron maius (strain Zn) TaxID=913774 RepID=A0A0C3H0Q0_OIDMZ|nr:hypothetical protein OIDMADRAFT_169738 [Oidiodendron maius Zn]
MNNHPGQEENASRIQFLDLPPELIILIADWLPAEFAACFALCNRGASRNAFLSNLMRSRVEQLETQVNCRTETLHCSECYMEFTIDATDFGKRGVAVFITRWTNFGSGLDPEDPKWESHFRWWNSQGYHQSLPLGSIRERFESQGGKLVKELTADNIVKLLRAQLQFHPSLIGRVRFEIAALVFRQKVSQ